jgi:hypothetical protein
MKIGSRKLHAALVTISLIVSINYWVIIPPGEFGATQSFFLFPTYRGQVKAKVDWYKGVRKVKLFGLLSTPNQKETALRDLGFNVEYGGCIVDDDHYRYWMSYNAQMVIEGMKLYGKRFPTLVLH